jgi:hypothetical protein
MIFNIRTSRRGFMSTIALGSTAFAARGAFAEELAQTPRIQARPARINR